MGQIDVNIIEPLPYLHIMEGIGPKGEKGDKGDPGEVSQAEFDELSNQVNSMTDNLALAMSAVFAVKTFQVSIDNTTFSDRILAQNGSSYGNVYIRYAFTIPPAVAGGTGFFSWNVNNGTVYFNTVDISSDLSGTYNYGKWSGDGRKPNEPIITGNSTFYLNSLSEAIARIVYCDRIHYGASSAGSLTDSFLLNMLNGHKLVETRKTSFTTNAGTDDYVWVALPVSYGTPTFESGGFKGGFKSQGTFRHTNNLGYATNYEVWRSDNKGLGNVTITIT